MMQKLKNVKEKKSQSDYRTVEPKEHHMDITTQNHDTKSKLNLRASAAVLSYDYQSETKTN